MAELADGERRAFDPVYRTLWPVLVRFVAVISGDRMIAEDMAQQAMLKILARVSTFDHSGDAVAWSMTIAINEYRSYRRKFGNRATTQGEWTLAEPTDDDAPEAIAIRDNLREAARAVMGQLRPQDFDTPIIELERNPHAFKPLGMEKLPGMLTWKLESSRSDGYRQVLYVDSHHGDIVKLSIMNAQGAHILEVAPHDYREVDGIRVPFAIDYRSSDGTVLANDRFERVEVKRARS